MTDYEKLRIEYARLLGNYQGTLEGIIHWDIPEELKQKLQTKISELNDTSDKRITEFAIVDPLKIAIHKIANTHIPEHDWNSTSETMRIIARDALNI